MNRYVDDRITFSYPAELRCTWHPGSRTYHLRRGSFHVFISLPEHDFWESLFNQVEFVSQDPRGSVDALGEPIPTNQEWAEDYAKHGFEGRARSTLGRDRFDQVFGKRVDLVVSRGERRIWLRIDSDKDFPLSLADPILQDMAFPDEETYAEALRLGPVKKLTPSPYVVSLKSFPRFGRRACKGRARYDVEYTGATVSDQQRQAVDRFVRDEEPLYEQAKLAVFRYYSETIYPMTSQIGRYDDLWPSCQTVEEVMRLVKLSSLMVHEPREDGAVVIGLRFHCSWDVEHGLGLRAAGSTIEAVGTDFVALDSGSNEWPEFRQAPGDAEN